jgi:hypothetical protein
MNITTETGTPVLATPDVSAAPYFGWVDTAGIIVVVALAGYYLYRKFWRGRGACTECGQNKSCPLPGKASHH